MLFQMMNFSNKLHSIVPTLAVVEPLALLLVAPLLLFPTVQPKWTAVGLALLAGLALARWIAAGELWPATPFNAALLLFGLMLPVAWWASAARDLSWPKLTGLILGLLAFRALALGIRDRRTLAWGLAAFAATGAGILAAGSLSTGWSAKFAFLQPLVQRLPQLFTDLPGAPDQGVNANQLAGATLIYLPFCLALAVGSWREGRRGTALAGLAGAAAAAGVLLLAQSRSGWIGGAAGLAVLGILGGLMSRRPRVRQAALVLPVILLLALGGALALLGPQRIAALWSAPASAADSGSVGMADRPAGFPLGPGRDLVPRRYMPSRISHSPGSAWVHSARWSTCSIRCSPLVRMSTSRTHTTFSCRWRWTWGCRG